MLEYRKRWARQPAGAVVASAKGVASGLVACGIGSKPFSDLLLGPPNVIGGSLVPAGFGASLVSPEYGSTDYTRYNRPPAGATPDQATVWALVIPSNITNEENVIGQFSSSSTNPLFRIVRRASSASQGFGVQIRGTGFIELYAGSNPTIDQVYSVGFTHVAGGGLTALYVDGQQLATSSTNPGTIGCNLLSVGAMVRTSVAQHWSGAILAYGVWNRALSPEEMRSLYRDPWQLFAPRSIPVPQAAISGLPTLGTVSATAITSSAFRPSVTYTY